MNKDVIRCPVCSAGHSVSLYPDYKGKCITSQMFFLDGIDMDNRCCKGCGFIYNAKGTRGIEESLYNAEVWKPKPQIMLYSGKVKTSHQSAWETFRELADLGDAGSLLDFGGGTGAFLECFHRSLPEWDLYAIEPGGGYDELCSRVPVKEAYNASYKSLSLDKEFDAIASLSVLEHVEDPAHALDWMFAHLRPGGLLLLQLPNFEKLPGDLLCADHINKMTVVHTVILAGHLGFDVVASDTSKVMFYLVLKKGEPSSGDLPSCFEESLKIARACEAVAESTIASVEAAVTSARAKGKKAAVFGTSPIGSMAHLLLDCKDAVACFVDENRNTWGRDVDGIPVVGPDRMEEFEVSDLALAISPLYWETVSEKMQRFPVDVHVPQLD